MPERKPRAQAECVCVCAHACATGVEGLQQLRMEGVWAPGEGQVGVVLGLALAFPSN